MRLYSTSILFPKAGNQSQLVPKDLIGETHSVAEMLEYFTPKSQLVPKDLIGETGIHDGWCLLLEKVSIGPEGPHW